MYKLTYATRLLDWGLASQAFHYCELIGQSILRHNEPQLVLTGEVIKVLGYRQEYPNVMHWYVCVCVCVLLYFHVLVDVQYIYGCVHVQRIYIFTFF